MSRGYAGAVGQHTVGPLSYCALLQGEHLLLETPYLAIQALERSVDILLF